MIGQSLLQTLFAIHSLKVVEDLHEWQTIWHVFKGTINPFPVVGINPPIILFVTNFIQPYLHQFFDDSHSLNGSQKPLKRPFNLYQLRLEVINNG